MNKVHLHLTSYLSWKGVFLELLIPKDSVLEPSFLPLSIIPIGENSCILTDTFLPPNYFSINLYSGTMKMEAVCLLHAIKTL